MIDEQLSMFKEVNEQARQTFELTETRDDKMMSCSLPAQKHADFIYDKQNIRIQKALKNMWASGIFNECVNQNKQIEAKTLFLHLAYLDQVEVEEAQRLKKKSKMTEFKGIYEEDLQLKTTEEVLADLRKLAQRYCLPEWNLNDTPQSKEKVFEAFMKSSDDPYYLYKQQATIDRTLIKRNFVTIQKKLPNFEAILKDITEDLDIDKKEKGKELEMEKEAKNEQFRKLLLNLRGPGFGNSDKSIVQFEDQNSQPELLNQSSANLNTSRIAQRTSRSKFNSSRNRYLSFKESSATLNSTFQVDQQRKLEMQMPHVFLSPRVSSNISVDMSATRFTDNQLHSITVSPASRKTFLPNLRNKINILKSEPSSNFSQFRSSQATKPKNMILMQDSQDNERLLSAGTASSKLCDKQQILNEIKKKINNFQGSEMRTELQKVNKRFSQKLVAQEFAAEHIIKTAELLKENCHLAPKILEWQFFEASKTIDDEAETFRQVTTDFKKHRMNINYNAMIERATRAKLGKNRNKKL